MYFNLLRIHVVVSLILLGYSEKICTTISNFPNFLEGMFTQKDSSYLTVHDSHVVTCVQTCMRSYPCQAATFDMNSGKCDLYNQLSEELQLSPNSNFVSTDIQGWSLHLAGACKYHSCPNNTLCTQSTPANYTCNIIGCLPTASLEEYFMPNELFLKVGAEISYQCDEGFYPNTSTVCLSSGFWSAFECLPYPTDCQQLQQCNSSYDDGEYWLFYPDGVSRKRIKVYCYLMFSIRPQEYISLLYDNIASQSPMEYTSKQSCNVTSNAARNRSTTFFNKIRIDVNDLSILTRDAIFTRFDFVLAYGAALDCKPQRNMCPALGYFILDLRNTTFSISSRTDWILAGNAGPYIDTIVFSADNKVVHGRCGGGNDTYCSGCFVREMYIDVTTDEHVDFDSAVLPVCNGIYTDPPVYFTPYQMFV